MSTVTQVVAAAPSWRESTKDRRRASISDRGPSTGTVTWWVRTSELAAALAIIDGVVETIVLDPGPPAITVDRKVPLQHPQFANMYAVGYEIEDYYSPEAYVTGISGTGPQSRVTVKFSTPEWPYGETSYTKVQATGFPYSIPTHPAALGFSGGGSLGFDLVRPIFGSRYTLSVADASGVTETQEAAWRNAAGKINSTAFRGCPVGTILMEAPDFSYRTRKDATIACDYVVGYSALPIRWDYAMTASGTLAQVLVGGSDMFSYVDPSTLIV
jgi:hypothetical protein